VVPTSGVTGDLKVGTPETPHKERKETRKENKKARSTPSGADPRFQPLVDYLFESYQEVVGLSLRPAYKAADGNSLKQLLKDLPDNDAESLKQAWLSFLNTRDEFHRKQIKQHPVRYWSSNINTFLGERELMVGEGEWVPGYSEECYEQMKTIAQQVDAKLDDIGVVQDIKRCLKRSVVAEEISREEGFDFNLEAFGVAYGRLVIERRQSV